MPEPWESTDIITLSRRIVASHRRWLGRDLIPPTDDNRTLASNLYEAPVVVVAHGTEADPVFCYANRLAQQVWVMDWERFTRTPSRLSAEAQERSVRQGLLDAVRDHGFVAGFPCIRITTTGRRFAIADTTVWNLLDGTGARIGQAATYADYRFLDQAAP